MHICIALFAQLGFNILVWLTEGYGMIILKSSEKVNLLE